MSLSRCFFKGRTQLCALLLAHGADPYLKNQESQTPLDLATAEDVKSLLQDAMANAPPTTVAVSPSAAAMLASGDGVANICASGGASGGSMALLPHATSRSDLSNMGVADGVAAPVVGASGVLPVPPIFPSGMPHPGDGCLDFSETGMQAQETSCDVTMKSFLQRLVTSFVPAERNDIQQIPKIKEEEDKRNLKETGRNARD
jgi:hypothetical protein